MDLNRHTSSDESGGNFSAELSYHKRSSISSGETRISDFRPKPKISEQKSEILVFAGRDARPLVVTKFRTKISSRFITGSMPIQVHGRA